VAIHPPVTRGDDREVGRDCRASPPSYGCLSGLPEAFQQLSCTSSRDIGERDRWRHSRVRQAQDGQKVESKTLKKHSSRETTIVLMAIAISVGLGVAGAIWATPRQTLKAAVEGVDRGGVAEGISAVKQELGKPHIGDTWDEALPKLQALGPRDNVLRPDNQTQVDIRAGQRFTFKWQKTTRTPTTPVAKAAGGEYRLVSITPEPKSTLKPTPTPVEASQSSRSVLDFEYAPGQTIRRYSSEAPDCRALRRYGRAKGDNFLDVAAAVATARREGLCVDKKDED
jgi:hypothetical protein